MAPIWLNFFLIRDEVHGIKCRSSPLNTHRIDHLYEDPHEERHRLVLHYGDITDSSSLIHIVQKAQPALIFTCGGRGAVSTRRP
jgi:GDPmannose 4,6-dehydratase